MAIDIKLLCNCYTCKEHQLKYSYRICAASLNTYDPIKDPAGYWLKLNKSFILNSAMCSEDADGCPCWRQGVEILPENSWYKR